MGRRRCTGRWATAICRPSMRSSTPAHRWTSSPKEGGPFVRPVGAGPNRWRVGAGQCRRQCRRRPQEGDAAALRCRRRRRRRNGRAARRRRGRVHREQQRVTPRRAARANRRPAAMPPVSCRNMAWRFARALDHSGAYAAAVAQAPTFGPSFTTFSRRHRAQRPHYCSCALAPARPSADCDAPDRPLLSAHSCACAAVPLRHAQRGRTSTFRGHAPVTSRCTANAPSGPLNRTSRVALQAQPLMAATKEVRSLAVRVRVGSGARECTRGYELRANHPPRGRLVGVFFVS